jgi:hypothetical protein
MELVPDRFLLVLYSCGDMQAGVWRRVGVGAQALTKKSKFGPIIASRIGQFELVLMIFCYTIK